MSYSILSSPHRQREVVQNTGVVPGHAEVEDYQEEKDGHEKYEQPFAANSPRHREVAPETYKPFRPASRNPPGRGLFHIFTHAPALII